MPLILYWMTGTRVTDGGHHPPTKDSLLGRRSWARRYRYVIATASPHVKRTFRPTGAETINWTGQKARAGLARSSCPDPITTTHAAAPAGMRDKKSRKVTPTRVLIHELMMLAPPGPFEESVAAQEPEGLGQQGQGPLGGW
jgi:hypothetical protein